MQVKLIGVYVSGTDVDDSDVDDSDIDDSDVDDSDHSEVVFKVYYQTEDGVLGVIDFIERTYTDYYQLTDASTHIKSVAKDDITLTHIPVYNGAKFNIDENTEQFDRYGTDEKTGPEFYTIPDNLYFAIISNGQKYYQESFANLNLNLFHKI